MAAARPPAPRKKFTTLAEMLAVLDHPVKAADDAGDRGAPAGAATGKEGWEQ